MRPLLSVLPIAALTLSACGPSLHYERDASMPIPARATWAWSAPDADSPVPRGSATLPADSIRRLFAEAIENELSSRGFARVPADRADFLVHFHIGQRTLVDTLPTREQLDDPAGGVRSPGAWGGYGHPESIGNRFIVWQEGMLVVDALPRGRDVVAWRGIIADEIPPEAERDPPRAIRLAVQKLMKGFP